MSLSSSVVVAAYNEEDFIEGVLDSIGEQSDELIVVAGGDDDTVEVARENQYTDKVIEEEDSSGPAEARNTGVDEASGDVVLFTDGDAIVSDDWVEEHLGHYNSDEVVGVGGPAKPIEAGFKNRILFLLLKDLWYRISFPVGFKQQPGFNSSFRREDFLEAGGFNEDMEFLEDTELSMRMKKHGKIVFEPDAWVKVSARREEDEGWLRVMLAYFRAYINHYLLGRSLREGYFERTN